MDLGGFNPLFSETPKYLSAPCLDSYHRIHRPTPKVLVFKFPTKKTVVAQKLIKGCFLHHVWDRRWLKNILNQFHEVSCKSNFLGLVRRSRVCPLQRLDRGELRRWREVGLATDSKTREPHTSSANKKQAGWLIYLRDGKGLYYALW